MLKLGIKDVNRVFTRGKAKGIIFFLVMTLKKLTALCIILSISMIYWSIERVQRYFLFIGSKKIACHTHTQLDNTKKKS